MAPRGIREFNAAAPGVVQTDMSNFTKTDAGRDFVLGMQALKRLAQPDDIGGVVAFLASEDARCISGDTIHVRRRLKALSVGRAHLLKVDAMSEHIEPKSQDHENSGPRSPDQRRAHASRVEGTVGGRTVADTREALTLREEKSYPPVQ